MAKVFEYNKDKLNIDIHYLERYSSIMKMEYDNQTLYEGKTKEYQPIKIKFKHSSYIYLYLMINEYAAHFEPLASL